jgi:putative ABC transport system permease protein
MHRWNLWGRRRAQREQRERELAAEIQNHLELEAEEQAEAGLSSRAAQAAAHRAFGNVTLVREDVRHVYVWMMVEQLWQDVRYAVRTMRRSPVFTATAVLSLALGIGVNTGIFSLADALLFRPLAIRDPNAVVTLRSTSPEVAFEGVSYPDFKDLRAQSQSFDALIAHRLATLAVATTADAVPQMRMGMQVSRDFFQALGVRPVLGRGFVSEETEIPGRGGVAVLSHGFWLQEFSADPAAIGRVIQVNGVATTIVGIAPPQFTGMDPIIQPYLYVPVTLGETAAATSAAASVLERRDERGFIVRGRLRADVTRARAQAELVALAATLAREYPDTNKNRGIAVRTERQLRQEQTPALAPIVILLLSLSGLVLAIVCANVANLFLSRARARSREIAIRLAIGSGQLRLVRQLLTESAVLAAVGGVAGIGLGFAVIRYLRSIRIPTDTPMVIAVQMDLRVLLFSLAVAFISALAFGLVPAWTAGRTDLVTSLKRSDVAPPQRRRMVGRQALVVAQVALSLVLLVTAGVMFDAFGKMVVLDPGFRTDRIMMMELNPGMIQYSAARSREFYRQLVERVRTLSGVRSASLSRAIPFRPNFTEMLIVPEGFQLPAGKDGVSTSTNTIDEAYFETMGIPIVRGRGFMVDDRADARRTAIVNETFASTYWPNQDPIGRRFRISTTGASRANGAGSANGASGGRSASGEDGVAGANGGAGAWIEVVGVARTVKYQYIAESPQPYIYLPLTQHPQPRLTLLVQTSGDPRAAADPLRQAVRGLDVRMPVFNVRTLDAMYQEGAIGTQRLVMQMVSSMGLLGLCLAIVGLYAVVAYSVGRRLREFGVRLSIGATRGDILRLVLREGLTLSGVGIAIGLMLGVPIHQSLGVALVGLGPLSPWTLVIVPAGLVLVTIAACLAPALRASRVDPTMVLRLE